MAPPTTYTEGDFKTFLHGELGNVATALGWTVDDGQYDEPVNEALLAYGASAIGDATDIRKLRVLGKLMTWRKAAAHLSGDYDFAADGASYSRSQAQKMAMEQVRDLEGQAMQWLSEYAVQVQRLDNLHDPYIDRAYDERLL